MIIRQETKKDYDVVSKLIEEAFKTAKHTDNNEHILVRKLRNSNNFIPELSLLAEIDNTIIGHILFTKAYVGQTAILTLAPVSVSSDYRNQGIGSSLITHGHELAKKMGYKYIVVLGDNQYYSRFGYVVSTNYNIDPIDEIPSEYYMAIKLDDNAPNISGKVVYAEEFNIS